MYDKPVQTEVVTADKAITDEPTLVYWLSIEPKDAADVAAVLIRDGFDISANVAGKFATAQGAMFNCIPPIRCMRGLYVDVDGEVRSCTVGFLFERIVKGKGKSLNSES